jgi:hypothetical protein
MTTERNPRVFKLISIFVGNICYKFLFERRGRGFPPCNEPVAGVLKYCTLFPEYRVSTWFENNNLNCKLELLENYNSSASLKGWNHVITKRCRLSLLTNSALVYEPKCGGRGELRGLSQWIQLNTGAQINFEDLTSYLTYGLNLKLSDNSCSRSTTFLSPSASVCK